MELLAIRLGGQETPAKSLVMSKGVFYNLLIYSASIHGSTSSPRTEDLFSGSSGYIEAHHAVEPREAIFDVRLTRQGLAVFL